MCWGVGGDAGRGMRGGVGKCDGCGGGKGKCRER